MIYVIFVIGGIVIGSLLWQLKKGGKIGLVGGLTIGAIGILFGGFIFPKVGITFGELVLGLVLAVCGAFIAVILMRMILRKKNN